MKFRVRSFVLFIALPLALMIAVPIPSMSLVPVHKLLHASKQIADGVLQPAVHVVPEVSVKWVVGQQFRADVMVENASGMRGIYFEVYWDGYYDANSSKWSSILNTSSADIVVYEDILPKPYKAYSLSVFGGPEKSWLKFLCILNCTTAPQNGTARIMSINFTIDDPWDGGRQPPYVKDGCQWIPSNATTQVTMWWGYSIVEYPNLHYLYFGEFYGNTEDKEGYARYNSLDFTFMPIPGDLDGNGVVDASDLLILSRFYGANVTEYPNSYYDLNRDGMIDISDIIVVSKNYGRTVP